MHVCFRIELFIIYSENLKLSVYLGITFVLIIYLAIILFTVKVSLSQSGQFRRRRADGDLSTYDLDGRVERDLQSHLIVSVGLLGDDLSTTVLRAWW